MLTTLAADPNLVGLTIIITIFAGIAMIISVIRRIKLFYIQAHPKFIEIKRKYNERIDFAAKKSFSDPSLFIAVIWIKVSRMGLLIALIFINFITYYMIFISDLRLDSDVSFYLSISTWTICVSSIVSIAALMFNFFEIHRICRYVLLAKYRQFRLDGDIL